MMANEMQKLCSDIAKASMPEWPFVKPNKLECCSTHCERWQECRSPNDCCGNFPLAPGVTKRMKDGEIKRVQP